MDLTSPLVPTGGAANSSHNRQGDGGEEELASFTNTRRGADALRAERPQLRDMPWFLRSVSGAQSSNSRLFIHRGCAKYANFVSMLFLQLVQMAIYLNFAEARTHRLLNTGAIWTCVLLQIAQVFLTFYWIRVLILRFTHYQSTFPPNLTEVLIFYCSTCISFAGIYTLVAACDSSLIHSRAFMHSTKLDALDSDATSKVDPIATHPLEIYILFFYFSISTQTMTGPGDLTAANSLTKLLVSTQITIGIVFATTILSQTTQNIWGEDSDWSRRNPSMPHRVMQPSLGSPNSALRRRLPKAGLLTAFRRGAREHIFLTSCAIQLLNYVVLFLIDPELFTRPRHNLDPSTVLLTISLQAVILLLVVSTSFKFVRHADQVSLLFMSQLYASVTVAFTGIYTFLYFAADLGSPRGTSFCISCADCKLLNTTADHPTFSKCLLPSYNIRTADVGFWQIIVTFLYFSLSVMSTTSFGDIFPLQPVSRLAVSFQMLFSSLLMSVVLGTGLRLFFERVNAARATRDDR